MRYFCGLRSDAYSRWCAGGGRQKKLKRKPRCGSRKEELCGGQQSAPSGVYSEWVEPYFCDKPSNQMPKRLKPARERESIALRSMHRNLLCAVGIVLRDEITRIFHPVRQGAAFRHAAPVHNPGRTARDRDLGVHVDNRHPGNHSCRGSCRRAVR